MDDIEDIEDIEELNIEEFINIKNDINKFYNTQILPLNNDNINIQKNITNNKCIKCDTIANYTINDSYFCWFHGYSSIYKKN